MAFLQMRLPATGKGIPKQIQVAGYKARVRARRQGDDNSALLYRLKRSEGGIPHLGKRVKDDKTVERLANKLIKHHLTKRFPTLGGARKIRG